MRLLLPTRISLALRRATNSPLSRAAATPTSKYRSRPAAPRPPVLLQKQKPQQLQQLWDLSKELRDGVDSQTRHLIDKMLEGTFHDTREDWLPHIVQTLSDCNDFTSIGEVLEAHGRSMQNNAKVPNVRLITDVLWAAALAKSLGSLPPSIIDWIEKAVRRLPEPIPTRKESMIWLLSILRDDFPMLQQLQQESSSKRGEVGPEIERKKTVRHAALAYLEAGKNEEFRSLWTSSGTPVLEEEDMQQQSAAMVHHAILRRTSFGKPDPVMLRWYAESLVATQRTPIPEQSQFETMVKPLINALGGRIEKWKGDDGRLKKLRKWRDDYDDAELDNLVHSMLDFMGHEIFVDKYGSPQDLSRLMKMLTRLNHYGRGSTVVIDWLNLTADTYHNIDNLLQPHSLVVIGRDKPNEGDVAARSPKESERVKVMNVTKKIEKTQEVDDVCALILAVATRGHLLTNDKTRPHIDRFARYVQNESRDVRLSVLLKNYLNDAVLRREYDQIQPVVDHSKGAQWIDKEKKELAFTVARKLIDSSSSFRHIDYYSMHID